MRAKVVSDGSAGGTKLLGWDGEELHRKVPIKALRWAIDGRDAATLEADIDFVEMEVNGVLTLRLRDKIVRRIEYADGTVDEFPA